MRYDTYTGYSYMLMGFALGAACGVLASPMLGLGRPHWDTDEEKDDESPSLGKKIVDKIPTRVKLAAAAGAVKGGGSKAVHIAKDKLTGEH